MARRRTDCKVLDVYTKRPGEITIQTSHTVTAIWSWNLTHDGDYHFTRTFKQINTETTTIMQNNVHHTHRKSHTNRHEKTYHMAYIIRHTAELSHITYSYDNSTTSMFWRTQSAITIRTATPPQYMSWHTKSEITIFTTNSWNNPQTNMAQITIMLNSLPRLSTKKAAATLYNSRRDQKKAWSHASFGGYISQPFRVGTTAGTSALASEPALPIKTPLHSQVGL